MLLRPHVIQPTFCQHIVSYRLRAYNYFFARLRWDNVMSKTHVSLHKKVAGIFSQIVAIVEAGGLNGDHTVEVVVSGTTHTLRLNGGTIGTATAADFASATRIGILAGANAYSPTTWSADNLLAQV